ncbi:metallophosphoesterase [Bradyrhizobium sp. S69]|uniref:metallophosphoesterase n=1 Tax=Bradyrhizobium sp. S69 TaxID=1641856 RepID=UPI00131E30CD|nr:metallophosphoesterase [Bradyrhizobium sp. S69]
MSFSRIATFIVVMILAGPMAVRADDGSPSPMVAQVPYQSPATSARYSVFISDLHFGVGKEPAGGWDPTEDFRWPKALEGFLNKIAQDGGQRVDLVIVGDFLELWQPPAEIKCDGVSADLGCSIDEMAALVGKVVSEHAEDIGILRAFAERGENRLHIIVGNHDSTLRYGAVWKPLGTALNADSGRINLVTDGVWVSSDGRIVAEHGNQIGQDVNKYATWPTISRHVDGKDYIVRPWGELFVQRLFNSQEKTYSIIDNLSPETAGARYRAADRGLWGSASDVARLLTFNLLETSLRQKSVMLGKPPAGKVDWDLAMGREKGAMLFLYALPKDDPLRLQLEKDDPDAQAIKSELTKLANDKQNLPDAEVQQLCDMIAVYEKDHICWNLQLGSIAEHFLSSKSKVMAKHLADRQATYKSMRVFIYGHTHQFEEPWRVDLEGTPVTVTVANTGAFQRLIDEPGFLKRLDGRTPQEALRTMSLDELPPCYTAVTVPAVAIGQIPVPKTQAWYMPEDGTGVLTAPDDPRCR